MSEAKLVDYDPDESSLEPGEVVTPPHPAAALIKKDTDKVHNESTSRRNKSDKKESGRHSTHRNFNQDCNPFHGSTRKRQFNARRGRAFNRPINFAHERWPKLERAVPEAELLWTKVKPSISFWFKGCKEFMKKLQSVENYKSKKTHKKSPKLPEKSTQVVVANNHNNDDNNVVFDDNDDEVDAWEEHFKKSSSNNNNNNNKKSTQLKFDKKKCVNQQILVPPFIELDIFEDTTNTNTNTTTPPSVEISNTPPRPRFNSTAHSIKIDTKVSPQLQPQQQQQKLNNNNQLTNKANDFDVLSIADLREQEAAEDRAKNLQISTPTQTQTQTQTQIAKEASEHANRKSTERQTPTPIHNSEPLLPDVSKDFKKLKALDNNLQRLQKMRESFDPTDDIWEELCKMETLFQKQKNFILLKYAKTQNADLLTLNDQFDGNSETIVNSHSQTNDNSCGEFSAVNETTIVCNTPPQPPPPADTGFLALNSTREGIKLKISPIKKPKSLQFNKKRNVLKQLWDDDDDDEEEQAEQPPQAQPSPAAATVEPTVKAVVETVTRQQRGVAIVKPIMEVKSESAHARRRNRESDTERRSSTADKRLRRRNTPQRRYLRSYSRSPSRIWPRRERFSPLLRKRHANYRRSSTPVQTRRPRTPACTPPGDSYTHSRTPSLTRSPTFFKPPSPPAARSETPESLQARSPRAWSREPRRKSFRPRSPRSPAAAEYENALYGAQELNYGGEYEQAYETADSHDQAYDIMQDLNGYYYNMQQQQQQPAVEVGNYGGQQAGAGYNNYLPAQYYEADREMYAIMGESEAYASYAAAQMNVNQSVLKELAKAPAMAVQKGNVLEIVPIQNAESLKPVSEAKVEFKENAGAGKEKVLSSGVSAKKTLNMKWLEEVENRQMQASVLRTLPVKSTILKPVKNDQTDANLTTEHSGYKKATLKQKTCKKKVFFEDGIYPSRDSSEEDRKAVDEILIRKVKRLRKKLTDKQLQIIRQVAPELDEENISAELDSLPPPAPPEGIPAAPLRQPVYLRPVSPDTFVFFHYDPEVCSMFVSAYEHAIPPRLLDAKNKAVNSSGAMTTLMLPFITPQQPTDNARLSTASAASVTSNAADSPPPTAVKPLATSRNEFVTQPLYPTTGPALMPHPPPMVPSPASYYNLPHGSPYIAQNIEPLVTRALPALPTAVRHNSLI